MTLHPGSLSLAYEKLQEHGFAAGTMRHACEMAAERGSYAIGRATITFDREDGYRVTTRQETRAMTKISITNAHGTFTTTTAAVMLASTITGEIITDDNADQTGNGPRQPCTFPGCLALFDPRQEDADPGDGCGLLTGWQWPADAVAAEDPELPAHDHKIS
jgi:hypothetical protein